MTKVRDVMTRSRSCCSRINRLADAAQAMRDHPVGSVLVVDGDKLCGLVTDRDIVVRAVAEAARPTHRWATCPARTWSRWKPTTTPSTRPG